MKRVNFCENIFGLKINFCRFFFQLYIRNLIRKLYDNVGFKDDPNDPQLVIYKRVHVLTWACAMGHVDCIRNSVLQFHNWKQMSDPDRNNP